MSAGDTLIMIDQMVSEFNCATAIAGIGRHPRMSSRADRVLFDLRQAQMRKLPIVVENMAIDHGKSHVRALRPCEERVK